MYSLGNIPADAPKWLINELRKVQEAMNAAVDGHVYRTLYAPPKKVSEGLVVKADGTTWNPGSGAGFYGYHGGAWHFLG